MMVAQFYLSLNSKEIAHEISRAKRFACYAAPGILPEPANALAELANRIGSDRITVCLDFDERVMRLGFGDISAVRALRCAKIEVRSTPGLRTGVVIIDDEGFIFTPAALYLEADAHPTEAPNAMRLSKDQATEALARLSPATKAIAVAFAKTEEERERISAQVVEVRSEKVADKEIETVERRLNEVPPVQFDVARQVRVYTSYLQYVDLKLSGAAIQRHRLAVPASILRLGGSRDLDGRLRTTFDLIQKDSRLSSGSLERELNEIRKDFTPSLGKNHGRVLLKSAKPHFEKRLKRFRDNLERHQEHVKKELQGRLHDSRRQIIEYYRHRVIQTPPDALLGSILHYPPTDDDADKWLNSELDNVFPKAEYLIQKMQLDVSYKDVTIETLSSQDFLAQIQLAFPRIDWDKAHKEFQAAGESE